jgi:hypothetical protein
MLNKSIALTLLGILTQGVSIADEALVLIGHSSLQKTDLATLQRLYTGRVVSLNKQAATPLNLPAGNPIRQQFITTVLGQNEEQYSGYWLVRRYVGKGAPPEEVATPEEIIRIVGSTPGAVGYIPSSKAPAGSNIIFSQ